MIRLSSILFKSVLIISGLLNLCFAAPMSVSQDWLSAAENFSETTTVTVQTIAPEVDWFRDEIDAIPAFEPTVMTDVDRIYTAPNYPTTTYPSSASVRVEVAGQAVNLPKLVPSGSTSFGTQLRFWFRQDTSRFRNIVHVKQQENGWSDADVQQLIAFYGSAVMSPSERVAFAAVYWLSSGYETQLYRRDDTVGLLLKLKQPVPQLPLVRANNVWWWAIGAEAGQELAVLNDIALEQGQALRLTSLNDRARTSQFRRIEFWFENETALASARWELPAHWPRIARRPADLASRFSEPLPQYVTEQVTQLTGESSLYPQLVSILRWLNKEFDVINAPLSLQQSLVGMARSQETTYQFVVQWWKRQTRQSAALIQSDTDILLALSLPRDESHPLQVEHRKRFWLVISSDLTLLSEETVDDTGRWLYLP